jgi:hypothetical protein
MTEKAKDQSCGPTACFPRKLTNKRRYKPWVLW